MARCGGFGAPASTIEPLPISRQSRISPDFPDVLRYDFHHSDVRAGAGADVGNVAIPVERSAMPTHVMCLSCRTLFAPPVSRSGPLVPCPNCAALVAAPLGDEHSPFAPIPSPVPGTTLAYGWQARSRGPFFWVAA